MAHKKQTAYFYWLSLDRNDRGNKSIIESYDTSSNTNDEYPPIEFDASEKNILQ